MSYFTDIIHYGLPSASSLRFYVCIRDGTEYKKVWKKVLLCIMYSVWNTTETQLLSVQMTAIELFLYFINKLGLFFTYSKVICGEYAAFYMIYNKCNSYCSWATGCHPKVIVGLNLKLSCRASMCIALSCPAHPSLHQWPCCAAVLIMVLLCDYYKLHFSWFTLPTVVSFLCLGQCFLSRNIQFLNCMILYRCFFFLWFSSL